MLSEEALLEMKSDCETVWATVFERMEFAIRSPADPKEIKNICGFIKLATALTEGAGEILLKEAIVENPLDALELMKMIFDEPKPRYKSKEDKIRDVLSQLGLSQDRINDIQKDVDEDGDQNGRSTS